MGAGRILFGGMEGCLVECRAEIRMFIDEFGCGDPGPPPVYKSCVDPPIQTTINPVTGHREVEIWQVRFATPHLEGSLWRHFINHETGHVLGLCDGGPDAPTPQFGCEDDLEHLKCTEPDSVMHTHGCAHVPWPSADDRASVESLIPAGSSGGPGGTQGKFLFG